MEYLTLSASPRAVLGKKVKQLRREGVLPANVFGKGLESKAIQLDNREFVRIVRASGIRSMFKLAISDESEARYVFVKALQRQGGMGQPIHVDFYQLDLSKPIDTNVTLHLTGSAPAVTDLAGTLMSSSNSLLVRAMPLEIPDALEADLGALVSFDARLTVADVKPVPGVQILTDPDVVIASVQPPRLRLDVDDDAGSEQESAAAEAAE